jgi:hypothetical protein
MATWIMERGLREQIERLLAEASDGPHRPGAAGALRARLAATLGEGLEGTAKRHERGDDDPALLAAYLDGALSEAERAVVLAGLADDPARRANLASAAALLGAIEPDRQEVPPGLMALAQSTFAPAGAAAARPRWIVRPRAPAIGWAGAALLVLVLVPGIVIVLNDRIGSPSSVENISPPRSEPAIPPPAAVPADSPTRLDSRTRDGGIARERAADQARAAPEPRSCDPAPAAAVATTAGSKARSENRAAKSAATVAPCPPKGAADAAKAVPSRPPREDGTPPVQRSVPATPSAVAPALAR